jgi:hypothetical protein
MILVRWALRLLIKMRRAGFREPSVKVELVDRKGPLAKKAAQRPSNYGELAAGTQWEIDKSLGILDWDGDQDK